MLGADSNIGLAQLAYACSMYSVFSGYDDAYHDFLAATGSQPDLSATIARLS
jgi:hypothetical protein